MNNNNNKLQKKSKLEKKLKALDRAEDERVSAVKSPYFDDKLQHWSSKRKRGSGWNMYKPPKKVQKVQLYLGSKSTPIEEIDDFSDEVINLDSSQESLDLFSFPSSEKISPLVLTPSPPVFNGAAADSGLMIRISVLEERLSDSRKELSEELFKNNILKNENTRLKNKLEILNSRLAKYWTAYSKFSETLDNL